IHLEQDAGKSVHDMDPAHSFVDLNRTGVALMEIVSRPDIRGGVEAAAYLVKMRQILRYLGTCDGNMQNGNMRADVNVSVCPVGAYEKFRENDDFAHLGTRCELKNMNSMRFIQQAIEYESRRQIAVLEDGGEITQETRLYDPDKGETRSMRSKEEAHDYRYFPDPDLLPLEISQEWVEGIRATLPELPDAKKARFIADYGVTDYDAAVLSADVADADYFESLASGRDGKQAANWVINELFGRLNKAELGIADSPVSATQLGAVLDLIADGTISGSAAKTVFDVLWNEGGNPADIIETHGLAQVSDTGEIEDMADTIIADNQNQFNKAKENPKLTGWFVGKVMAASGGKANPKAVNEILTEQVLYADIFSPRWGHDDRYDLIFKKNSLVIKHLVRTAKATWDNPSHDAKWTGEGVARMMRNDHVAPPEDIEYRLERLWRAWKTKELTLEQLQDETNALADYINIGTRAKPNTDFWNK
nr:Asp-tRNA(Asn)/Glu-tRNA(Gln) amidotransferase subunit GatB [Pseudomonadota bacterium]